MELELEVYYVSQEALRAKNLGLDYDDSNDCELRKITLYNIDHIVEYSSLINFKPATRIISGGMDYLVNIDYKSLKQLISENI